MARLHVRIVSSSTCLAKVKTVLFLSGCQMRTASIHGGSLRANWGLVGSEDEDGANMARFSESNCVRHYSQKRSSVCSYHLASACVGFDYSDLCANPPSKLSRLRPFGGPGPASISSAQ